MVYKITAFFNLADGQTETLYLGEYSSKTQAISKMKTEISGLREIYQIDTIVRTENIAVLIIDKNSVLSIIINEKDKDV